MMAAGIDAGNGLSATKPRILFHAQEFAKGIAALAQYDVTRDGRFIMLRKGSPEPPPTHLNVVLNEFEELKSRGH
jgi:hypothetical protein